MVNLKIALPNLRLFEMCVLFFLCCVFAIIESSGKRKDHRQSFFLCWDNLKHDVPLVDATCTDQDEDEERDVVHHELHQLQSDAFRTSEDETQNVRTVVLAKCQVYPCLETFHHSEKRIFFSSHPSCLCHETLQAFDQWMAEPSRQTHQCQQQESNLWHT